MSEGQTFEFMRISVSINVLAKQVDNISSTIQKVTNDDVIDDFKNQVASKTTDQYSDIINEKSEEYVEDSSQ